MPDVLVRDVPEQTLDQLKRRAAEHRRSLQRELLVVLESAAADVATTSPAEVAAAVRRRLARSGRRFTDSTPLIRQDRAR